MRRAFVPKVLLAGHQYLPLPGRGYVAIELGAPRAKEWPLTVPEGIRNLDLWVMSESEVSADRANRVKWRPPTRAPRHASRSRTHIREPHRHSSIHRSQPVEAKVEQPRNTVNALASR